ncbi:MAG TPA: hypothetical protein VG125_10515 [Pirellulales bacterium]|jgi:hypothetical protein|nr:hypothetical protein [Pirellulales bacterium]
MSVLVLFGHDLQGPTANRPTNAEIGQPFFDTTLNTPLWWNGSAWEDATGGAAGSLTVTIGPATVTPTMSVASGASATLEAWAMKATTITVTGNTHITTAGGFNFGEYEQPTYSAASALTIDNAATLKIDNAPLGGGAGPVTITNAYALWVGAGMTYLQGGVQAPAVDAAGSGALVIGGVSTGIVSIGRGANKLPVFSMLKTSVNAQNAAPTIAQLLGGYISHTSQTGAGTFTTPTGAAISGGIAGVAVGDAFSVLYANIGNQTVTITAGDGNVTFPPGSLVAIPTHRYANLTFINTGANTWDVVIEPGAAT